MLCVLAVGDGDGAYDEEHTAGSMSADTASALLRNDIDSSMEPVVIAWTAVLFQRTLSLNLIEASSL